MMHPRSRGRRSRGRKDIPSYTRESWESFDFFDRGKVGEEKIEDEDWQVGQVGLVSGRRMMTGRICAMSNDIEKRI